MCPLITDVAVLCLCLYVRDRLKVVAQPQYSQEEAEAAVGMAPSKKT